MGVGRDAGSSADVDFWRNMLRVSVLAQNPYARKVHSEGSGAPNLRGSSKVHGDQRAEGQAAPSRMQGGARPSALRPSGGAHSLSTKTGFYRRAEASPR